MWFKTTWGVGVKVGSWSEVGVAVWVVGWGEVAARVSVLAKDNIGNSGKSEKRSNYRG